MKILITLLGWLLWNAAILRIEKDKADDSGGAFSFKDYASKNWDNWVFNLVGAAALLVVGQEVLHVIKITEGVEGNLNWSDAYYLGSGFFTESLLYFIKKWKKGKEAA